MLNSSRSDEIHTDAFTTGIWAIDFADLFPSAEVLSITGTGKDSSPNRDKGHWHGSQSDTTEMGSAKLSLRN